MWTSPLTSPHKCPLLPLPHHPHPQILLGPSTEDQSSTQRAELLEELAEVMALQERALALDVGLPQLRVSQQMPGELSPDPSGSLPLISVRHVPDVLPAVLPGVLA